jgi:hypothetical protein
MNPADSTAEFGSQTAAGSSGRDALEALVHEEIPK